VDSNHQPVCMCASLFEGVHCETQSKAFIVMKQVISATTIIAIISICVFYLIIVVTDVPKVVHYVRLRDHVYRQDLVSPDWRNKPKVKNRKRMSMVSFKKPRYVEPLRS
jgi:hypothetical protein